LSVREAWLRTEVVHQKLGLTIGRIDVTTHIDRNAAANDETTQFISDALVNNPVLGLSSNGFGGVAEWDPKKSWNFKIAVQQSADPNNQLGSLADSMFKLAEFEYVAQFGGVDFAGTRMEKSTFEALNRLRGRILRAAASEFRAAVNSARGSSKSASISESGFMVLLCSTDTPVCAALAETQNATLIP
jgi:hypothetical protein